MPTKTQQQSAISETLVGTERLHISPLTEVILARILGTHFAVAQDISFHQIPNYPNKAYGFVTLPLAEAAMVRRKLHGTILRGEKVAVENARQDIRKERAAEERAEDAASGSEPDRQARVLRKRKREIDVIPAAVVLPEDRKVKRGWTETKVDIETKKIKAKRDRQDGRKDKKSKPKTSSYTDQAECLFETTLPGNAVKDKSLKDKRDHKKNNKRKGNETVTIHEFENTIKHASYLRQTASGKEKVQEYDDEKGWIDQQGNVMEVIAHRTKPQKTTSSNTAKSGIEVESRKQAEEDDMTSSSGSSEDDPASGDSESESVHEKDPNSPAAEIPAGVSVSITASSPATPHPLETLFKKPQARTEATAKANLEIDTSFSFFSSDVNGDEMSDTESRPQIEKSLETPGLPALKRRGLPNLSIPVTPYSQKDMNWRAQRSAAPTPDTAAPGKSSFGDPFGLLTAKRGRENDIEEEDEDEQQVLDKADDVMQGVEAEDELVPSDSLGPAGGKTESEFSKWFWENRGNNTKTWKKRKRDAAKEQKSRETRKSKG